MSARMVPMFPDYDDGEGLAASGVLHDAAIRRLIRANAIVGDRPFTTTQVQPASLDLRLGAVAYQVRASFLPTRSTTVLEETQRLISQTLTLTEPTLLEVGSIYVIPLIEALRLPHTISGKANAKSTTGRLDVFTRLLADNTDEYDRVPPGHRGGLYIEVAPRTFGVLVHEGTTLNQLRFLRGATAQSDNRLNALHQSSALLFADDNTPADALISNGLWISVDLKGARPGDIVGYKAKPYSAPIDLDLLRHYDVADYWDAIVSKPDTELILEPDQFYILASKERIRIPMTHAAEMVSHDPTVGELRIHYAGFFDPGFGDRSDERRGTRAVLEVRCRDVPFLLRDGQRIGRLTYERLIGTPRAAYGVAIGSSYQGQNVTLSKQFRESRTHRA